MQRSTQPSLGSLRRKGLARLLVVDTDVLIDVQRGFAPALLWLATLSEPPAITGFTALELIQDARDRNEVEKARSPVRPLAVFWPSTHASNRALECFANKHLSHGIGLLDILIAFTVIETDAELCTFNLKHFRAVPGLRLAQPYRR